MAASGGPSVAVIRRGAELRFCLGRAPAKKLGHSGVDSAVVRLIESVYSEEERWSVAWLRGRIFTTEPKGVASSATVKVAARRVAWEVPAHEMLEALPQAGEFHAREVFPPEEWPPLESDDGLEAPASDTLVPVRASLACGGVTTHALNRARRHRTRHAEVRLIRDWLLNGRASSGTPARLRVSLKSCKMCAAWIFEAFAPSLPFEVIFDQPDPGPLGSVHGSGGGFSTAS